LEPADKITVFFTYPLKTVLGRLAIPLVFTLILIVSLIFDPPLNGDGIIRLVAFSVLGCYSLWFIPVFLRRRSTSKNSALHTLSVFLAVALLVQGVYLLNSRVYPVMTILITGAGSFGIFYFVMFKRTRESSMLIVDKYDLQIMVEGKTFIDHPITEIHSAESKSGDIVLVLDDNLQVKVPTSGFDNTGDVLNEIRMRMSFNSSGA
jgi:hypothetical protein